MHKDVVWAPLAENDFYNILTYLQSNWKAEVLTNFIDITNRMIGQIAMTPKQFPVINKKYKVRKCVLTKHNTLFYTVTPHNVYILRIYDTRQNPKRLKFA